MKWSIGEMESMVFHQDLHSPLGMGAEGGGEAAAGSLLQSWDETGDWTEKNGGRDGGLQFA